MERFDRGRLLLFTNRDIPNETAVHDRGWFVLKMLQDGASHEEALNYANVWIMMKHNRCTYHPDIMNKVNSFVKKYSEL